MGDHIFSAQLFRHHLFRCRLFSTQIVSTPIRCSLTVHLLSVWVSASIKHRILVLKRAAPKSRGPPMGPQMDSPEISFLNGLS